MNERLDRDVLGRLVPLLGVLLCLPVALGRAFGLAVDERHEAVAAAFVVVWAAALASGLTRRQARRPARAPR